MLAACFHSAGPTATLQVSTVDSSRTPGRPRLHRDGGSKILAFIKTNPRLCGPPPPPQPAPRALWGEASWARRALELWGCHRPSVSGPQLHQDCLATDSPCWIFQQPVSQLRGARRSDSPVSPCATRWTSTEQVTKHSESTRTCHRSQHPCARRFSPPRMAWLQVTDPGGQPVT